MIFNWDTNLSDKEFLVYANNPESSFFAEFAVRVLAMAPYEEVFKKYISLDIFMNKWESVLKAEMQRNFLFSGQVQFWDEVWNFCRIKSAKHLNTC